MQLKKFIGFLILIISVVFGSQSSKGYSSDDIDIRMVYQDLICDSNEWKNNRPDFPQFEVILPKVDDGYKVICYDDNTYNYLYLYFIYPYGEVIFLKIKRIVNDISWNMSKIKYWPGELTRKSHGYYYDGCFEEYVDDYVGEYNGETEIVNRVLNVEDIHDVQSDVLYTIERLNRYKGYQMNNKEYIYSDKRKVFYFIKDDILVMLYNIKQENFHSYYSLLSSTLKTLKVRGDVFAEPKNEIQCNWRERRVDSMPSNVYGNPYNLHLDSLFATFHVTHVEEYSSVNVVSAILYGVNDTLSDCRIINCFPSKFKIESGKEYKYDLGLIRRVRFIPNLNKYFLVFHNDTIKVDLRLPYYLLLYDNAQ